ncbi:hypothetical protein AYO38_08765 [bacterium SCGC AG-212-C10]|nr:hypothetical protein AYO38_08765 [bacterium SCGC AG-212-C10]
MNRPEWEYATVRELPRSFFVEYSHGQLERETDLAKVMCNALILSGIALDVPLTEGFSKVARFLGSCGWEAVASQGSTTSREWMFKRRLS